MKPLRIVAIVVVAYLAIVVVFESVIGYSQPADESYVLGLPRLDRHLT